MKSAGAIFAALSLSLTTLAWPIAAMGQAEQVPQAVEEEAQLESTPIASAPPPPFFDSAERPTDFDKVFRPEHIRKSIDLYRMAKISYETDGALYKPLVEQLDQAYADVRLYGNQAGKLIHCERRNRFLSEEAVGLICADVMEKATLKPLAGFDLGGWPGVVDLSIFTKPTADFEAVMPIRFVRKKIIDLRLVKKVKEPGEVSVTLMEQPRLDQPICNAFAPVDAADLTDASYKSVCDAFLASKRIAKSRCKKDNDWSFASVRYKCRVKTQQVRVKDPPKVTLVSAALARPGPIEYPPLYLKEMTSSSLDAGRIRVRLQYPMRALRRAEEGVTQAVIGFDKTGDIKFCRPLRSSGSRILDRETCVGLLRSGRFLFSQHVEPFEGLQYRIQPVRWTMP